MPPPKPEDIEAVIRHHFPHSSLMDHFAAGLKGLAAVKATEDPSAAILGQTSEGRKVQALRQRLSTMPAEEVARLAAQAAAAQAARRQADADALEAARFYNLPTAKADLVFWAKVENWTPDDAVALLLGRDPRVVNPASLAAELKTGTRVPGLGKAEGRADFHRQFDELRTLVQRSDVLSAPRIKPQAVIAWARSSGAAQVPDALAAAVAPREPAALTCATEHESTAARAVRQEWTAERRAELAAVRLAKGTKAAAAQFGISEARVRKLLPSVGDQAPAPQLLQAWPQSPRRRPSRR